MIESYLPHPRDPELGQDEYFVLDTAGRVQHVRLTDIFPGRPGEDAEYGVRRVSDGMRIDSGYGDPFRGFAMLTFTIIARIVKTGHTGASTTGST